MISFIRAIFGWVWSGFELLPKSMIILRFSICQDCKESRRGWFRNYCNTCKCTIGEGSHPFNKCAHPCEECPLLMWSKIQGYECEK